MSTILKALRRLEQEKSAGSDRPLSEALVNAPVPPPPPRSRSLWLAVTGALVVAAVAGGFFWLRGAPEPVAEEPVEVAAVTAPKPARTRPTPAASPAARPRSQRPAQPVPGAAPAPPGTVPMAPGDLGSGTAPSWPDRAPSVFPRSTSGRPELPPEALASDVEVVRRVRPEGPPNVVTGPPPPPASEALPSPPVERPAPGSPRPNPASKAQPAPTSEPRVAAASPPRATAAARASSPSPEAALPLPAAEKPVSQPTEPASGAASRPPEPAPQRAKQIARSPVPDLVVEKTIWHPLAERRVAVVLLTDRDEVVELHEGDAVGPLVVARIEPTGVLFLHDGVELRRRVGAP